MGGNTTSGDFAPAPTSHGWLSGFDLQGNMKWGKFFYNVSYAVSAIQGCQMSSDGTSLTISAVGNSMPVVMSIETQTGTIRNFINLDHQYNDWFDLKTFENYGAVFLDEEDSVDGSGYLYSAFVMNGIAQMARFKVNEDSVKLGTSNWAYEL